MKLAGRRRKYGEALCAHCVRSWSYLLLVVNRLENEKCQMRGLTPRRRK